jgi:cold shock protein
MQTTGVVRFWEDRDGWGVIDSAQTPGGCWAHFSVVQVPGHRTLAAGEPVTLEWEVVDQDGFAFRATLAFPASQGGPIDDTQIAPTEALSSILIKEWDGL